MKTTELTFQQIERAIRKIADKFPPSEEANVMTDIHFRVTQDTGELMAFDDNDEEINRCIIEEWIDNTDDNFFDEIPSIFRKCLDKMKDTIENMSILKPFSFVLENDEKESIAELYLVDDETVIIDPDLMQGLDEDLNDFLKKLLED
ncbi:hypothetical protein [Xylanibacter ruminicola]|jgi:hypothetical protein|uniref:Uncharacterized protein n=1 Tax=Xylanibacter ruminicola TaxID=839 RepID=A0A1M6W373_XYLRU|nr:hypothetical protein [Xylanibacter ruminicola]SHK88129.1 hypothetical protein SAMN05216463_11522 [Xylanibacter ruminicola]